MSDSIETGDMKIVMTPTNVAMNPMLLTEELQRRGLDASHIKFVSSSEATQAYGFRTDRTIDMSQFENPTQAMLATLQGCLDDGVNLFHFWAKSMVFATRFGGVSGIDLPLIKAHDRRILHRFTGFDARVPSEDMELNPYSPFHYGYDYPYVEHDVLRHRALVRDYADRLIVQDPELGQFIPEATVIPRVLNLDEWAYSGPTTNKKPLVVHAPTNTVVKGTPFIVDAVESLQREGLPFEFKLIEGMAQSEARDWYRRADVVVDQILIGATGVLTLEAWALGKPVVVNLRPELFEPFYGVDSLPIVRATPDTIVDSLRQAISDAALREELGVRGRALIEEHHRVEAVTDRLVATYREVLDSPAVTPTATHDVGTLQASTLRTTRTIVRHHHRAARRERAPAIEKDWRWPFRKLKRLVWDSAPSEYSYKVRRFVDHARRDGLFR